MKKDFEKKSSKDSFNVEIKQGKPERTVSPSAVRTIKLTHKQEVPRK